MKKLFYLFSAILIMALASCSSKADYEQIAQKIDNGDEITQADYAKMIEYLETPAIETFKAFKEITPDNMHEIAAKTEEINAKYPYADPFARCIQQNMANLDEENIKKFQELELKIQKL